MSNRNVLITGASSGIGYELAKIFARERHNLILVARNRTKLEDIKTELTSYGVGIEVVEKDLIRPNAAQELYDHLCQKNIRVDILINNAGFGLRGDFNSLDTKTQLDMIQLNIVALTHLTHLFVQDMVKQGYGRIMNVGSIASFVSVPSMSVYAATKAYVLAFSEALNTELKDKGDIKVTALCPGPTYTNFAKAAKMGDQEELFNKMSLSASFVAEAGYEALKKGKPIEIPATSYAIGTIGFTRLLPRRLLQALLSYLNKR